jgi:IclR family acetate operon transcriptional repressor
LFGIVSDMQKSIEQDGGGARPAYPITSVDNALRLLKLFAERESIRLTDACQYLNVAHSTAHRLLAMLVHHGFVRQDPVTRAYRPGPTLMDIGLAVVQKLDIRAQARPVLEQLAERFGETIHLVVLEGTQVRYLDAVESTRALRVAQRLGNVLPAHCTSAGKALLAEMTDDQVRALYSEPGSLEQKTDRSVGTLPRLLVTLDEVRQAGYATNYEETEEGVGSVAIALRDRSGTALAAVAVAVPTSRLNQALRREISDFLAAAADQFAASLP